LNSSFAASCIDVITLFQPGKLQRDETTIYSEGLVSCDEITGGERALHYDADVLYFLRE
jgi:hypothetical protein